MAIEPFNLATEEVQTAIKTDTTFIKEQFPIKGGTDFSSYSKVVFGENVGSTSTPGKSVLSVTGAGVLTTIDTTSIYSVVTVIVDGTIALQKSRIGQISMSLNLIFDKSLSILVDESDSGRNPLVKAVALLK